MRSLTLKLTLAFLFIGLIGAGLVAFFVGQQTRREFNRFVLDRYELDAIERLATYYENNGSWDGIQTFLVAVRERRPGIIPSQWRSLVLADANNIVVAGGPQAQIGEELSPNELRSALPIEVEGEVVGRIILPGMARGPLLPDTPESRFLGAIQRAILLSALAAVVIALLLGVFLARTISRPLRELQQATLRVAQGELGVAVPVRTADEIGELATSFNQMSADLAQANRLRRQMTADIAHDLRTPTSVLMGYTEALSDGKLAGSPQMYGVMHKEAQHLSRLIDDLRTLSLADAGELPLTLQEVAPRALLERTAGAHQVQARKQGVTLQVEVEADLPSIRVDPDRMAQVLDNLVSNALRYTPAGGQITLAASRHASKVKLDVRDTGSGVAPQDLPNIFRRFFRSDQSRQQNGESGLGLAIARSIVEAHGGTIEVASTPGAGATFTITLESAA